MVQVRRHSQRQHPRERRWRWFRRISLSSEAKSASLRILAFLLFLTCVVTALRISYKQMEALQVDSVLYVDTVDGDWEDTTISHCSTNTTVAAIAVLVSNQQADVDRLCQALRSLRLLPDIVNVNANMNADNFSSQTSSSSSSSSLCSPLAPVLIFHEASEEDGLTLEQQRQLKRCTYSGSSSGSSSSSSHRHRRHVTFPTVDFQDFPKGFDPIQEQPNFQRRSKWGYHQMIRFWITTIWEHPAIQQYNIDTIMQLDSDACYRRRIVPLLPSPSNSITELNVPVDTRQHGYYVPGLPPFWDYDSQNEKHNSNNNKSHNTNMIVYHAGEFKHDNAQVTQHFGAFVHQYVRDHNLTHQIASPNLFAKIPDEGQQQHQRQRWGNAGVPMFYNNFEITRVSFMLRPDVQAFHHAMTEKEPFGVFRYRWGDAIERYATMAIFATEEQVIRKPPYGYQHPCGGESVITRDNNGGTSSSGSWWWW